MAIGGQLYDGSAGAISSEKDCYNYCLKTMLSCTAAQTFTNADGTIACVLYTSAISSRNMFRVDGAKLYIIQRCNDSTGKYASIILDNTLSAIVRVQFVQMCSLISLLMTKHCKCTFTSVLYTDKHAFRMMQ